MVSVAAERRVSGATSASASGGRASARICAHAHPLASHPWARPNFVLLFLLLWCVVLCTLSVSRSVRWLCRGMAANADRQGVSLCRWLCRNLCRWLCRALCRSRGRRAGDGGSVCGVASAAAFAAGTAGRLGSGGGSADGCRRQRRQRTGAARRRLCGGVACGGAVWLMPQGVSGLKLKAASEGGGGAGARLR